MKRRSFFGTILGAVTAAKAAPKLKLTASDLALNLNRTNLSMVGHGLMERPEDDMRLVYMRCKDDLWMHQNCGENQRLIDQRKKNSNRWIMNTFYHRKP